MTRENAIKIVEKKLNAAGLGEAIKISNSRTGTHGEAQCIYIDPIPVKGNSKLIKKWVNHFSCGIGHATL